MHKILKIALVVCFLTVAVYFVQSGAASERQQQPEPPKLQARPALRPGPAPELALPAGFQSPCADAINHSLPLPGTIDKNKMGAYEKQILDFLIAGSYKKELKWCGDKGVRDTGPYLRDVYYGSHPAVRVWYSPEIMDWLIGGRVGQIPDGAMIIKDHYQPPSGRYAGMSDEQLPVVHDWTFMIRDNSASADGWFWGDFFDKMKFDDDKPPFQVQVAGPGMACIRCHASAETDNTFIALANIKGFPGTPIIFPDDGSWKRHNLTEAAGLVGWTRRFGHNSIPVKSNEANEAVADPDFLAVYQQINEVQLADVRHFPPETYDNMPAPGAGPNRFVTSNQCMGCHGGLTGPFAPVMFLPSNPGKPGTVSGMNVSPYAEWRWSPMGLAGRDPIFFSQLESELAFANRQPSPRKEELDKLTRNTCLSCHGVMGKRQLDIDNGGPADFHLDYIYETDRNSPTFKYGAWARDGISCTVCHRTIEDEVREGQTPLESFLNNTITGRFRIGPASRINGPYATDDVIRRPMENALEMRPIFNKYLTSSRMCGSCHTIDLPVLDGRQGQQSIEQATYLEWLNSEFQDEFGTPGPKAKSCQGCHMPGDYHSAKKGIDVDQIKTKIAAIQDELYPEAEYTLPLEDLTVKTRDKYSRHELVGVNVFLLQMFSQFWEILGVRRPQPGIPDTYDYMTGSATDLDDAIDNMVAQAREKSATLDVAAVVANSRQILANVCLKNLAGHRFPSGVGFRRLFVEFLVKDKDRNVVWASGRTNKLGVIIGANGTPLPSEFHQEFTDTNGVKQQSYQPHYQVVDSQDKAQIYEELTLDATNRFTSNFLLRDHTIKDNRLLPRGWTEHGPDPSLNGRFLEATHAEGADVLADPDYHNGLGGDTFAYLVTLPAGVDPSTCTVEATLNYQAIPPRYLADRFSGAPTGSATRRLYYLTSNLETSGTPIENWKLRIISTPAVAVTPADPSVCAKVCARAPQYFLNRLDRLPVGFVRIAGSGPLSAVSTSNRTQMRLALEGGSSPRQRFNREYVALQLSLLLAPGDDNAALSSPLSCYLRFGPFRLSDFSIIRETSTLKEFLAAADAATRFSTSADLIALGNILDGINSNDPSGRCGP